MSYLPRGIVGQPALQVSGIPAREQASALQVAQLLRGLRLRRDHLVEGVIEGHRVIVSTLVLKSTSWIQEQEHDSILHFSVQTPMTQHSHPPMALYLNLSTSCREPVCSREAHPWVSTSPHWNISVALIPSTVQGSYLIPWIGSVSRVDKNSNDFGSRQQGCTTFWYHLCVKVIGTLLKHEVCAGIGGNWKEFHVPAKQMGCWWAAWPNEKRHRPWCPHSSSTDTAAAQLHLPSNAGNGQRSADMAEVWLKKEWWHMTKKVEKWYKGKKVFCWKCVSWVPGEWKKKPEGKVPLQALAGKTFCPRVKSESSVCLVTNHLLKPV